ncbi:MAG TPA: translation initiation factor IF-2 [Caldilineaceae bacterium]|nr:translation initiation factor IF-2 [Caldilineaceae bacterium]
MTTMTKTPAPVREQAKNGSNRPPSQVTVGQHVTVRDLADRMIRSPIDLIKVLMQFGIMAPIDQVLDHDTAAIVGEELGVIVTWPEAQAAPTPMEEEEPTVDTRPKERIFVQNILARETDKDKAERPPVVAVLGHVDHGKTTLLDRIRKTKVVDSEAGGITQHTGAYQVDVGGRKITFLDTPGHEAFTAMRARGAQVTDIVVLVVAADDGIMPQTQEAISHAKAAGVQIVVAINKIDRPNANIDRVMEELSKVGLQPEAWGGDTIVVPVSALRGTGVDDLLENILVVAELEQYSANPKGRCIGTVIEAQLDKYRGVTATLLIQNGTLKQGDSLLVGTTWGRIKAMFDYEGKPIKKAEPSTPVVVLGLQEVPAAGEVFERVKNDKEARSIAADRQEDIDRASQAVIRPQVSLEDLFARIEGGETETLNLIVRADVQGTLAPVVQSLEELANEEIGVKILQAAIGDINESDVMLAEASDAIIIGFSVGVDKAAQVRADQSSVEIRHYDIIYKMIEDVELALTGMLEPIYEMVVVGHAEVRQLFRVRRGGLIAGCMVLDGIVKRNAPARLLRNGEEMATSTIATLKRFSEDVSEVRSGFECGLHLGGINTDLQEGDIIEILEKRQVR